MGTIAESLVLPILCALEEGTIVVGIEGFPERSGQGVLQDFCRGRGSFGFPIRDFPDRVHRGLARQRTSGPLETSSGAIRGMGLRGGVFLGTLLPAERKDPKLLLHRGTIDFRERRVQAEVGPDSRVVGRHMETRAGNDRGLRLAVSF